MTFDTHTHIYGSHESFWWLWWIVEKFWSLEIDSFSSYFYSLVIFFLLVEAVKELRTEKKKTGILLNSTGLQLFRGWGTFFPSQEKAVYSIERCKETRERVFFGGGCLEAYLFPACTDPASCQRPPGKIVIFVFVYFVFILFLFLCFCCLFFFFFFISYSIPANIRYAIILATE